MRILIEGHQYEAAKVKDLLPDYDKSSSGKKLVMVNCVGYYYNATLNDCVFILPKVLLEDKDGEEKVFGTFRPEDVIDLDKSELQKKEEERRFIYELAVLIYRAINVFNNAKRDNKIVEKQVVTQASRGFRHKTETFLDIILALLKFNRENQDFVFFVLRNLHSGFNKINWTRTMSKSTAIVQDNRPIYLNPVNKKRQINFDEELLVIFFSILNYINKTFGFKAQINCNFELIQGNQFKAYIEKGLGRSLLLQIKYKYFSDKALELWELCYTFFNHANQVNLNANQAEYIVVKNFNLVFEAMIDELIGDKDMENMKEQDDGKIIDHIYRYKDLFANSEGKQIYYVGDSKYYKIGHEVKGESLYKQFTYARNITQWHLDLFRSDAEKDREERNRYGDIKLRDELTEGYNIIPNFFISAMMNKKEGKEEMSFSFSDDKLTHVEWNRKEHMLTHFPNRIYDRDTLLVFHFKVNFLYVLSLYARNNYLQKERWKGTVREMFRMEILKELNKNFTFHKMTAKPGTGAREYIEANFQKVLGKIYIPFEKNVANMSKDEYKEHIYKDCVFSLALDKCCEYKDENDKLLLELSQFFNFITDRNVDSILSFYN